MLSLQYGCHTKTNYYSIPFTIHQCLPPNLLFYKYNFNYSMTI
jgi:hypothetical protein